MHSVHCLHTHAETQKRKKRVMNKVNNNETRLATEKNRNKNCTGNCNDIRNKITVNFR